MRVDVFAGTRTPRPPAEVRERVLRAARAAALPRVADRKNRWRPAPFDLAWVAALLVLMLCHALLSRGASRATPARLQAIAEERQLKKELGLNGVPMVVAGRQAGRDGETQRQLFQDLERL